MRRLQSKGVLQGVGHHRQVPTFGSVSRRHISISAISHSPTLSLLLLIYLMPVLVSSPLNTSSTAPQEPSHRQPRKSKVNKPDWDWLEQETTAKPETKPARSPTPPVPSYPRPRRLLPETRWRLALESLSAIGNWENLCKQLLKQLPHPICPIKVSELDGLTRRQQFVRLSSVSPVQQSTHFALTLAT